MKTHPGCQIQSGQHSLVADTSELIEKFNRKMPSPIKDVLNPVQELAMKQRQDESSFGNTPKAKGNFTA